MKIPAKLNQGAKYPVLKKFRFLKREKNDIFDIFTLYLCNFTGEGVCMVDCAIKYRTLLDFGVAAVYGVLIEVWTSQKCNPENGITLSFELI